MFRNDSLVYFIHAKQLFLDGVRTTANTRSACVSPEAVREWDNGGPTSSNMAHCTIFRYNSMRDIVSKQVNNSSPYVYDCPIGQPRYRNASHPRYNPSTLVVDGLNISFQACYSYQAQGLKTSRSARYDRSSLFYKLAFPPVPFPPIQSPVNTQARTRRSTASAAHPRPDHCTTPHLQPHAILPHMHPNRQLPGNSYTS